MREALDKEVQLTEQLEEVYDELKSEVNTLRENCVKHEGEQFMEPERLERLERLYSEEHGEINSFVIEVPGERIPVDKATTVGAVGVGVDADLKKKDNVKCSRRSYFVDNDIMTLSGD